MWRILTRRRLQSQYCTSKKSYWNICAKKFGYCYGFNGWREFQEYSIFVECAGGTVNGMIGNAREFTNRW